MEAKEKTGGNENNLSIKAAEILNSRFSLSHLPNEATGPDTLMSFVKKQLKESKKSKVPTSVVRIISSPSSRFISPANELSLKVSKKNINIFRRHSLPLIKKSAKRLSTSPRIKKFKRLRSLGIPKLHRSFIVQGFNKQTTPKTPQTFRNVTVRRKIPQNNDDFVLPKTPQKNNLSTSLPVESTTPLRTNENGVIDGLKTSPASASDTITHQNESESVNRVNKSLDNSCKRKIWYNDDGEKLILTPEKAGGRSFNSDTEYERMYETLEIDNHQPTDFTFEAVELADNFEEILEVDDKMLAGMLEEDSKMHVKESVDYLKDPLSTETFGKAPAMSSTIIASKKRKNDKKEANDSDNDNLNKIRRQLNVKKIKKERKSIQFDETNSEDDDDEDIDDDLVKKENSSDDSEDDFKADIKKPPISKEAIKKLRNIVVRLDHQVPEQHKIGTACSLPLTKDEKNKFNQYSVLKVGAFNKHEDRIIKDNWKKFCKTHKLVIENKRFFDKRYNGIMFIKDSIERKRFVQFLANGLPNRCLFAVFKRFERIYEYRRLEEVKSRRYTKKEDKIIIKWFEKPGSGVLRSSVLPKLLNRPFDSIHRRYYYLRKKLRPEQNLEQSMREITWTLSLIKKFIKNLLDITISENINDLKDAMIPGVVWQKLEEKVGISWKILRYFWLHQLHMQLFCPREIYLNDVKIMIIEYLYVKGITKPSKVNWRYAVKNFDGFTSDFLVEILHRMKFIKNIDEDDDKSEGKQLHLSYENRRLTFGKFVDDLHKIHIDKLIDKKTDLFLPRLSYTDGKLRVIDL